MSALNKYGELEGAACPQCGDPIKPQWVACPGCGMNLQGKRSVATASPAVSYRCPGCGQPANSAGAQGPGGNRYENKGYLCRTCSAFVHHVCCENGKANHATTEVEKLCPVCREVVMVFNYG